MCLSPSRTGHSPERVAVGGAAMPDDDGLIYSVNDRLIYSSGPMWRGTETVLLNTAVSVFFAAFAVPGIAAVVGGVVYGSAAPVFFGILWTVVYTFIIWTQLRLAWRSVASGQRVEPFPQGNCLTGNRDLGRAPAARPRRRACGPGGPCPGCCPGAPGRRCGTTDRNVSASSCGPSPGTRDGHRLMSSSAMR